jgi:hypothetical protein
MSSGNGGVMELAGAALYHHHSPSFFSVSLIENESIIASSARTSSTSRLPSAPATADLVKE